MDFEDTDDAPDWPTIEALFVAGRHVEADQVDWEPLGVKHPESGEPLLNCKRCLSIWNTPTKHWCNPIREVGE